MSDSFWPDDLLAQLPRTPKDILLKQAGFLGEKTNNTVLADVEIVGREGAFVLTFLLRVPALKNYRYDLFRLAHGVELYPVRDISSVVMLHDEHQLEDYVREKLTAEETVKIIRALVAQATESEQIPF